jgi:hypothetical protein
MPVITPIKNKAGETVKIAYQHTGDITRQAMKRKVQQLSNQLKQQGVNAKVSVAIQYKDSKQWKSGYMSDVGDDVKLHNVQEYDSEKIENPDSLSGYVMYVLRQ